MLTSFLTGLTDDPRFNVSNHNCGFDFIAMLPTRTTTTSPFDDARLEKLIDGQLNRMNWLAQTTALMDGDWKGGGNESGAGPIGVENSRTEILRLKLIVPD